MAIGRDPDVHDLIGAHTRVVDLRGRLVVPGFNDAYKEWMDEEMEATFGPRRRAR